MHDGTGFGACWLAFFLLVRLTLFSHSSHDAFLLWEKSVIGSVKVGGGDDTTSLPRSLADGPSPIDPAPDTRARLAEAAVGVTWLHGRGGPRELSRPERAASWMSSEEGILIFLLQGCRAAPGGLSPFVLYVVL